jgi:hypothetical protein
MMNLNVYYLCTTAAKEEGGKGGGNGEEGFKMIRPSLRF